jgi:acetyl esterase/lipase
LIWLACGVRHLRKPEPYVDVVHQYEKNASARRRSTLSSLVQLREELVSDAEFTPKWCIDENGEFHWELSMVRSQITMGLYQTEGAAMKPLIFALCVVFAFGGRGTLRAQTHLWQPSPGHTQVPIWPGAVPDAQPVSAPESETTDAKDLVAGRPLVGVGNVSRPTMTVYSPKGKNTGAAVVVFPGGGYIGLAIDLEGTEVCDWLTAKGITCVLLKYRVPDSGPAWHDDCKCYIHPKAPMALQDAQRTVGLVRLHATKWHIDPHKIGVLGFSAGGHMVADISTHFAQRSYPPVDAADEESCRPDFAVAIYPGHLWIDEEKFELNPNVPVTKETPPTFLLQAEDDHVDGVNQSLVYYIALKKAGVPVEMHLYAQGGHAFGLRRTKLPITEWPALVDKWLGTIGMIPK